MLTYQLEISSALTLHLLYTHATFTLLLYTTFTLHLHYIYSTQAFVEMFCYTRTAHVLSLQTHSALYTVVYREDSVSLHNMT